MSSKRHSGGHALWINLRRDERNRRERRRIQELLRNVLRRTIGAFSFFDPWAFLVDLPTRLG
jgi:hypothetical protein